LGRAFKLIADRMTTGLPLPFTLPRETIGAKKVAEVLAFGNLSLLEACTVLQGNLSKTELPSDRVSVLTLDYDATERLPELAGAHKLVPLAGSTDGLSVPKSVVDALLGVLDEKSNLSLSGYGLSDEEYDTLVRQLLDAVRESGLRKVRLLRPKGQELMGEDVVSRSAVDVVAFPYHGGFGMGLTAWVPDENLRRRGFQKPAPRPELSMSPRLARSLLNLAGLMRGQTVLDPFCGAGTILSEAIMQGYRCLGLDSSASRVQDTRENLKSVTGDWGWGYDIRKGDARELYRILRGTKVDGIVTEPLLLPPLRARPKRETANFMVNSAAEIYSDALSSMSESVQSGGRIVIVTPVVMTMDGDEVSMRLEGRKLGLKLHQPGPIGFEYPIRLSFESTRWVRRAVYVFEKS
jgi:RMKL-like, methyltransferase domain